MAMLIRPYQESDEDAVVALWHACGLTRPWNDPHKDIASKLTVQRELFFVGEAGARVVASVMVGFDGHRGWVNYLAVTPEMQGNGYGAEMMKLAEEKLKAVGCPKINLMVRTTNASVIAFYRSLGYAVDDVVALGKRLTLDD